MRTEDYMERNEAYMLKKIESVLNEYVRPELSSHYGDVKVLGFTDGTLEIKLEGQCSNCPSAKNTVENLIETEIKKYVPAVERVVLMQYVSDDLIDFAKKILNHENRK